MRSPPRLRPHWSSPAATGAGWVWRWALLGAVIGILITALWYAPARWLAMAVAQASDNRVQLVHPKGTLWQGRADVLFTGGSNSRDATALPQGLSWQLQPTWRNGPALRLRLQADCCMTQPISLTVQALWSGVAINWPAHQSQWPSAWLTGLGAPWNTLQLQGQLQLNTSGLDVRWQQGRLSVQGALQIDALSMASRLATLRPLGSYRLQLQAPGGSDTAQLQLNTLDGALQLSGTGQWSNGRLSFQGQAQAREDAQAALNNLLNIIGKREGRLSRIALIG